MHAHFSGGMGYTSPTSFPGMGGYCAVASFVCNLLIGCGMQHVNTQDLEVDVDERMRTWTTSTKTQAAFSLAMRFVRTGNLIRWAKAYANAPAMMCIKFAHGFGQISRYWPVI